MIPDGFVFHLIEYRGFAPGNLRVQNGYTKFSGFRCSDDIQNSAAGNENQYARILKMKKDLDFTY
jgi:hypothetical protein